MTKATGYGLVAVLACALLLGCGGGGVNQGTHDMLQMDHDATLAALMEAEGERDTAQAEVRRLTALIGADTDAADADGSLYAQINAAQTEADEASRPA